jgi:hypothetical protein
MFPTNIYLNDFSNIDLHYHFSWSVPRGDLKIAPITRRDVYMKEAHAQ